MSSPFPMNSPQMPGGQGGPGSSPVFGAGRQDDPGYLASMRRGTEIGRLRMMMLLLAVAPVLILAIVPAIVRGGGAAPPWVYAPLAFLALLALLVGPRVPRPMEPGMDPEEAVRTALMAFRQAVLLRFALADAVVLAGLPLAIVGDSELVFLAGFVVGYPLLIWLAVPTNGGVERMRRRLESAGAQSHLWAGLLAAPAPPGTAPRGDVPPADGAPG